MDKDKRIAELEAQLAQAEMKLDRTTALFIKAEAKLARVGEELVNNGCDCDFDDLELLPKCLACRIEYILSDQPKVLAVDELSMLGEYSIRGHQPSLWTRVFAGEDRRFNPVTVIVLGKEEE